MDARSCVTAATTRGGMSFDQLCRGDQAYYVVDKECLVDVHAHDSLQLAEEKLVAKINNLFQEIQIQREAKIKKFYVGKTFVRKAKKSKSLNQMEPKSWRKKGISSRWSDHKQNEAEYGKDGMMVIAVITKSQVPLLEDGSAPVTTQEQYTLALEQRLIQYYTITKKDTRIHNPTFSCGGADKKRSAGYALYVAFSLEEVEDQGEADWGGNDMENNASTEETPTRENNIIDQPIDDELLDDDNLDTSTHVGVVQRQDDQEIVLHSEEANKPTSSLAPYTGRLNYEMTQQLTLPNTQHSTATPIGAMNTTRDTTTSTSTGTMMSHYQPHVMDDQPHLQVSTTSLEQLTPPSSHRQQYDDINVNDDWHTTELTATLNNRPQSTPVGQPIPEGSNAYSPSLTDEHISEERDRSDEDLIYTGTSYVDTPTRSSTTRRRRGQDDESRVDVTPTKKKKRFSLSLNKSKKSDTRKQLSLSTRKSRK